MIREKVHHIIYLCCLLTIACSIPLSNYVMSMGGIFLAVNWFLEWNWKIKWQRLSENKGAIILSVFFFVCCFALLKTDNWSNGFNNILSKLPLLYTPIIMASSKPLSGREQRLVILGFIAATLFGTIYSLIYLLTHKVSNIREISLFISHIRFSLCIVLAIFLNLYLCWKVVHYPKIIRFLLFIISVWFIIYLFIAQTLTGIVILMSIVLFLLFYLLIYNKKIFARKLFFTLGLLLIISFFVHFVYIIYQYYDVEKIEISSLPTYTSDGHPYRHDLNSIVENGSITGLYVCKEELMSDWVKKSSIPYDHEIELTLIRYLNSKGLTKDKEGLKKLSAVDIRNIEMGIANIDYSKGFGLKRAVYPILFSLTLYEKYNKIDHSSLLQRIELWKATYAVIKENFWFGVGIGDHKTELDQQLIAQNSPLTYKNEMGCHNQYLTYWLMGGVFLFCCFIFTLFFPFFKIKKSKSLIYIIFFIIIFLSLFTEDTLETQAGMTLYAFFNSFLLFIFDRNKIHNRQIEPKRE